MSEIKRIDTLYIPAMDGQALNDYLVEIVNRINLLSELVYELFEHRVPPTFRNDPRYEKFKQLLE